MQHCWLAILLISASLNKNKEFVTKGNDVEPTMLSNFTQGMQSNSSPLGWKNELEKHKKILSLLKSVSNLLSGSVQWRNLVQFTFNGQAFRQRKSEKRIVPLMFALTREIVTDDYSESVSTERI